MSVKLNEEVVKKPVKGYFQRLFDIRDDTMENGELYEMMKENTSIHGSNMWILIMAIFIASIGLNVNSTAVIIGAMLISPLMSGILTMGFSLATSDLAMLKKAFISFGTQVIISLITSTLYFIISPLDVPTSEMIARTSPTIWDVLIALFGGIAGMIGNTRQKKGNVIPGVAIATALMPPLCTAGYGIATMQLKFLYGAFYLFAINTLFIMLSSALVTKLLKVPARKDVDEKKQKRIKRFITIITIVTVLPSILFGAVTVYSTVLNSNIEKYIEREFVFPNTQVVQKSIDQINGVISISLVGETISDEAVELLNYQLSNYGLDGYKLRVTQNYIDNTNEVNADKLAIAVQENTIKELQKKIDEQQEIINEMENNPEYNIDCQKLARNASEIFEKLTDCSCGLMSKENNTYILLTGASSGDLSQEEKQTVINWLKAETGLRNVEIVLNGSVTISG